MSGLNTSSHTTNGTLAAVESATAVLTAVVDRFGEADFARPSLLPGWTRGHVVTHLARNADALVNLLTWARTGIEHAAYPSRADRDAAINAGATRLGQVQREDLIAASARFQVEAGRLTEADWAVAVQHPHGEPIPAVEIPERRLFEVWTHLVDLDAGVGFDAVPAEHLDLMLDRATHPVLSRTGGAPVRLRVDLPDGRQRSWEFAIGTQDGGTDLSGSAAAALSWLTGRGDAELDGTPPELAAWG